LRERGLGLARLLVRLLDVGARPYLAIAARAALLTQLLLEARDLRLCVVPRVLGAPLRLLDQRDLRLSRLDLVAELVLVTQPFECRDHDTERELEAHWLRGVQRRREQRKVGSFDRVVNACERVVQAPSVEHGRALITVEKRVRDTLPKSGI